MPEADDLQAAMAKLYSSEIAVRGLRTGTDSRRLRILKEYPAENPFREQAHTIGEGTSEINGW